MLSRILFLLALFTAPLSAATKYCWSGASGSGNGNDWTNAYTTLAALQSGMSRGDTGYVADGNYASTTFNKATSGSSLMTIKKATVSDHGTSTGWSDTMGDGQAVIAAPLKFTTSYWTFTGQTRSGLRSGHGFRVDGNTSKSTAPQVQIGVSSSSAASNVTLSYVEIQGSGEVGGNGGSQDTYNDSNIIMYATSGNSGAQNTTIDHCWLYDSGLVPIFTLQAKYLTVEHNVIEKNDSTDNNHSEGIVLRGKPSSSGSAADCGEYIIRYNVFSDIEGTAYIGTPSGPTHWFTNCYIYGNVFIVPQSPTRGGCGGGPMAFWDVKIYGDFKIYNNSFIHFDESAVQGVSPVSANNNSESNITFWGYPNNHFDEVDIRNNLWVDCEAVHHPTSDPAFNDAHIDSFTWTYSSYYATGNTNDVDSGGTKQTMGSDPLPSWQSGNYVPSVETTAGQSLSSPYNVDGNSITRAVDGTWTRGAYEYNSGASDVTAPTVTAATINSAGTNLSMVFSEAVTFAGAVPTISATGGAATLSSPTGSGTGTLVFPISRVIAAGETVTRSYTQPGNGIEDAAGNDLATFATQAVTNGSTVDAVAPTPSPMTFSSAPSSDRSTQATMTASLATDASSGPVQYFFDETSGNAGGTDSTWQSSRTYTDTGLTAGVQYTYRVKARDSASAPNETSYSSTANVTTLSLPVAPSSLNATTISENQINLAWTDGSSDETGFSIERSLSSGTGFAVIATVAAGVTTYEDIVVVPGTTYYYRVRAYRNPTPDYSTYTSEDSAIASDPIAPPVTPIRSPFLNHGIRHSTP